jgi:alpha-D-ribose 1-methylphosphonate 5-triphosphate synthase subunit PhnH
MARPGTVHRLSGAPAGPSPLDPSTVAVCLTLIDLDTPLWADAAAAPALDYLRFHCGCPLAEPQAAAFALIAKGGALPPLDAFPVGQPEYPDRSATLIVQVAGLIEGRGRTLAGPGIDGAARLDIAGLDDGFWPAWADNLALFPLGVDAIFTAGDRVAALPRTTRVEG